MGVNRVSTNSLEKMQNLYEEFGLVKFLINIAEAHYKLICDTWQYFIT